MVVVANAVAPVARLFADPRSARGIAEYVVAGPYDAECQGHALLVLAAGTEWEGPLAAAARAGDSLPWLVYADWLDELGEARKAAVARRVGAYYAAPGEEMS